ncbi:MAG: riboflavin synthase [Planctomycetaceae bacterium]
MFTGLVEGLGTIAAVEPEVAGLRLRVDPQSPTLREDSPPLGASIALNGCCLTVVAVSEAGWDFQAGQETLSRTNLGALKVGDVVNIERSLPANGRLGGHFVQGHIDGVGNVDAIDRDGQWVTMWFRVPPPLTRQMVSKGSVAVDGISLTLVDVTEDRFSIALIPHTLEVTTLGHRAVGDVVNIETDILGKYLEKLLTAVGGIRD